MRNYYLKETSCAYQTEEAARLVTKPMKDFFVVRLSTDGHYYVHRLVLIPLFDGQTLFALSAPDRSRLEQEYTAAKTKRTVDFTPTWSATLRLYLAAYENGTPAGRKIALEELQRMAQVADLYNADK